MEQTIGICALDTVAFVNQLQQINDICEPDPTEHWHLCTSCNRLLKFACQMQKTTGSFVLDATDHLYLCTRYNRLFVFVYQMQQTSSICVPDATDHWHLCTRCKRPLAFLSDAVIWYEFYPWLSMLNNFNCLLLTSYLAILCLPESTKYCLLWTRL